MPESLDDKLARAFANIEVKLDAIDKRGSFQSDTLQKILTKLTQVEYLLNVTGKSPKS